MKRSFFEWLGGFFEDASGKASRKAATLYACLAFLGVIVIKGIKPDELVLAALVVIILFCLGAITREQVGKIIDKSQDKKS